MIDKPIYRMSSIGTAKRGSSEWKENIIRQGALRHWNSLLLLDATILSMASDILKRKRRGSLNL